MAGLENGPRDALLGHGEVPRLPNGEGTRPRLPPARRAGYSDGIPGRCKAGREPAWEHSSVPRLAYEVSYRKACGRTPVDGRKPHWVRPLRYRRILSYKAVHEAYSTAAHASAYFRATAIVKCPLVKVLRGHNGKGHAHPNDKRGD